MNRFLLILSLSFIISGELDVDGDLNVSGLVQSPTIQALLEQIAQLEDQIVQLQQQIVVLQQNQSQSNMLKYQIVTVEVPSLSPDYYQVYTNLNELLPGVSIDWAHVTIVGCDYNPIGGDQVLCNAGIDGIEMIYFNLENQTLQESDSHSMMFINQGNRTFFVGIRDSNFPDGGNLDGSIDILITYNEL